MTCIYPRAVRLGVHKARSATETRPKRFGQFQITSLPRPVINTHMKEPPNWGEQSPCAAPPGILSSEFSNRIALFKSTATTSLKEREKKGGVEIEEQHYPSKCRDILLPSASHTQELHLASGNISFLALSATVLHLRRASVISS